MEILLIANVSVIVMSEVRRLEKKHEKKIADLNRLCNQQIETLWMKHDGLKGAGNSKLKAGLVGKVVGIEWVQKTLLSLQYSEEKKELGIGRIGRRI